MGNVRADDGAFRLRRLLIAGFVAALLPLLPAELRYHGDERFYTDGALHMLDSGDYLTPAYADGKPRFLKPGLSYWLIAASFKMFGVGLASSRLPSLLAGAGVLLLTGRAVLALGGSESASLLAVAILASNMSLLLAAMRSTPDALLCLFLSASLFGFLRLVVSDDRSWRTYALAYLGAGLALAVKGLLGLLPVVFAFLFCILGRRRGAPSSRTLIHWPLMAAGAAVGLFWFAAVLVKHGSVAWAGFFSDQISGKVETSHLRAIGNVPRYLLAVLQHFLPWSAVAAVAWFVGRRDVPQREGRERLAGLYVLGVFLVMVAIFAAGRDLRPRYLLPAYPLIAVVISPWLARHLDAPGVRAPRRLLQATIVIAGLGGVVLGAAGFALDGRITLAGLILVAASVLVLAFARSEWRAAAAGTALLVTIALPLHDLLIGPVFNEQPARLVAARVSTVPRSPGRIGLLGMGGEFAGQLSLHLRGRVSVISLEQLQSPALPPVLVATEKERTDLLARGYRVEACGFLQRHWTFRDIRQAMHEGGVTPYIQRMRIPVYLAFRGSPLSS